MRRVVAALVLLASAVPALAAPPTKAELFAKAQQAAAICAEQMPDSKATRAALSAAGFRKETSADLRGQYYSALGYRVIVMATLTHSKVSGCGVMFADATPEDAQALLQPMLAASGAKPVAPPKRIGADRAWIGDFKGGPTLFFVDNDIDVGPIRGALAFGRSLD